MRAIIQPLVVNSQQLIVEGERNNIHNMIRNDEKMLFASRLNALCDEKSLPLHGRQSIIKDHFIGLGIKMSQESVRKWLMGESVPRHENKIVLCEYFQVTYEWLSTGKGEKRKHPAEFVSKRELEINSFSEVLRKLGDSDFERVKSFGFDLANYLLEKSDETKKTQ